MPNVGLQCSGLNCLLGYTPAGRSHSLAGFLSRLNAGFLCLAVCTVASGHALKDRPAFPQVQVVPHRPIAGRLVSTNPLWTGRDCWRPPNLTLSDSVRTNWPINGTFAVILGWLSRSLHPRFERFQPSSHPNNPPTSASWPGAALGTSCGYRRVRLRLSRHGLVASR